MTSWLSKLFRGPAPVSDTSSAESAVQTDTWRIVFPPNWTPVLHEGPLRVFGPLEALVTLSPYVVSGGLPGPELDNVVQELEDNALRAIAATQTDGGLTVVTPIARESLPDGTVFHESLGVDPSSGTFVAQYALRRGRTVLLVTHEGPSAAEAAIPLLRHTVRSITWLQ